MEANVTQLGKFLNDDPKAFTALGALRGMNDLLDAQRQNFQIVSRSWYARIHTTGFVTDPATGLVENLNVSFFSGNVGNPGNGFIRNLTEADIAINTPGMLSANKIFVANYMGVRVDSSMPEVTQRSILNRGLLTNVRGNLQMTAGRPVDWPCPFGIHALAAATTNAQTTISPFANGPQNQVRSLPADGLIFFPAKQEVRWNLVCQGVRFFSTTNGLPLAGDGTNAIIPNNGAQGEEQGYVELIFLGYEITQPG